MNTKKLTTLAMLTTLAYLVMAVGRIPVVLFLSYDPKDVIITIGGFIFGPMSALIISVLVSVVEMFTLSSTGVIGLFMNVLASTAFACPAAFFYKKYRSVKGAVAGLSIGLAVMVIVMILWNYFVTPLYMGVSRAEVAALLVPAFLPFNLLKGGLNAAITMILYKPVVTGLRKAGLVEPGKTEPKNRFGLGVMLTSSLVLGTCVMFVLVMQGVL